MLLRNALGETLRHARMRQKRTLRDVSTVANISLGYLSEVERGQKEASSELLASICEALDLEISDILDTASSALRDSGAVALADRPALVAAAASRVGQPRRGRDIRDQDVRDRDIRDQDIRIVVPYLPASPSAPSPA